MGILVIIKVMCPAENVVSTVGLSLVLIKLEKIAINKTVILRNCGELQGTVCTMWHSLILFCHTE